MSKKDVSTEQSNTPRSANCPRCDNLPEFKLRWEQETGGTASLRIEATCDCGTVAMRMSNPVLRPGQLPLTGVGDMLDAWRSALPELLQEAHGPQEPAKIATCSCKSKSQETAAQVAAPSVDERLDLLLDWYNDRLAGLGAAQAKLETRFAEDVGCIAQALQELVSNVDVLQETLEGRLDQLEEHYAQHQVSPTRAVWSRPQNETGPIK